MQTLLDHPMLDEVDEAHRNIHQAGIRLTRLGEWADTSDLLDALAAIQVRLQEVERELMTLDGPPPTSRSPDGGHTWLTAVAWLLIVASGVLFWGAALYGLWEVMHADF